MTREVQRDFVGYGRNSPVFQWPGGCRLALNVVLNYEEGSERSPLDGDTTADIPSEPLAQVPPADPTRPAERPLITESVYEYGSRVAVWRMIDLFDRFQVKPSVFACAVALERNLEVTSAFVERGYDMVGHGYRWISHYGLNEAQEREQIQLAVASIQRSTGYLVFLAGRA